MGRGKKALDDLLKASKNTTTKKADSTEKTIEEAPKDNLKQKGQSSR